MKQIFHNGEPSHGGDRKFFEVMTSILPKGTLGSVTSLLAPTLYQGNPDKNHKLRISYHHSSFAKDRLKIVHMFSGGGKLGIKSKPLTLFILFTTLQIYIKYK